MGPSWRSRSSRPREAVQLPDGPSAPAWRPVGWVARLDAAAGSRCVPVRVLWARGAWMRPVPVSLAYPHYGGGSAGFSPLLPRRPLKSVRWGLRRVSASWPLAREVCQEQGLRSGTWDCASMLCEDGVRFLVPQCRVGTPSCPCTCWGPGAGTGGTAWHAAFPQGVAGVGVRSQLGDSPASL